MRLLYKITQQRTWLGPKHDTRAHKLTGKKLEQAVERFLSELNEFCEVNDIYLSHEVPALLRELAASTSPDAACLARLACQRNTAAYDDVRDRKGTSGFQPGRCVRTLRGQLHKLAEAVSASSPPEA